LFGIFLGCKTKISNIKQSVLNPVSCQMYIVNGSVSPKDECIVELTNFHYCSVDVTSKAAVMLLKLIEEPRAN
jgi:hypothetical protein